MKNFTNNFKQITSRLSARWLITALMLLVGTSSAWAVDKVIYITTGTSTGYSNPYIYVWNNSSNNSWPGKAMDSAGKTSEGYPVYKYEWTSTINNFIVMDGSCGDGCKKTADVSYSQTKNYIYNVKTGKWSSYNPCETPTIAWNDFAENMCVGNQQTLTATASNGAAVTFSSSDATYASISGTKLTAVKAGSATITASVAASGNYCSATADKTVTISNCIPVGTVLYLKPSTNWASSNARFALYLFKDGGSNTWVDATPVYNNNGYYEITVPDGVWEKMIWCRMNPSGSNGWTQDTQKWNQTGDLTYDSRYNLFTIPANSWDNATTTWSAWTPEPCCTDVAKPTIQLASSPVKCGVDVTAGLITIDGYDDSKYTYTLNKDGNATTIAYNEGYAITEEGSYTVTADVSENSCGAQTSDPQDVTVTDNTPTINSFTVTPASDNVCEGSSVTLAATQVNGATYAWYKGDSATPISGAADYTYSPIITENTTFKVVVTKTNNGCPATAEATSTIQVIELPAAPTLNSNTDEVCSGVEFTLPGDYNWYEVSTGGTKLNSATISGGITSNKSYWAEAKNASGCVSSTRTEYTLTVNNKPAVPTLSADKTSLIGDEKAVFTVGNTVAGLTYTLYNGENAGESQTSTGRDLTFIAGGAGSYTVKVTNSCGTSTSSPIEITVCTPQTNEFRHANSSYTQLQDQPTYYPGDKAYFVSTGNCCLTGTWSNNLQKGEEGWWTGLSGSTPKFSMTLTRAGEFTITNMATNGCTQDKNVLVNLDFTVTALSEVTNANGTASGADIALTWKHSTNHTKVMVVRYPTAGTETIPAGGQAYTEGNTLGGGTVVYVGTAESCTDKNLPAGASYKYYFYTVNNNYYSKGVVLNMSSCPTPAKPQLTSSAVTTCNGNVTTLGSITITNIEDYDNTYTFKLGDRTANPDANGKIVISSADNTEYTVTVTNSCGNQNSATVDIAINDNKPTIFGPTYAQPGKDNAIELTLPAGISAKWSVSPEADLSVNEGNSTKFSAEKNDTYTITADNKGCTDTHVVTVSDAFYVYMRQPKKGENAYDKFYFPTQNPTQGGDLFYKEYASIPPAEGYTDYNQGGRAHDVILTDCDGYVWYGFKASAQLIDGTNYFTVHAPNKDGYDGWFTHTDITKPGKMTGDIYYIMGTEGNGNSGWKIEEASAPYSGPVVHASGNDFSFNKNNFADFVALYVTDCSGKEVKSYQWQYSATENGKYDNYSSVCTYVGKKSEQGDAGKTNNIRPNVAGWYRCTATYTDGSSLTSAAKQVTATSGTSYSFTSDLPIIMVNTNGYGFPSCDGLSGTASKNADVLKAKISVDVKIKLGNDIVYDRKARMNYRGSSSLNFVKKSYAFCPGKADCVEDKGRVDYVKTEKLNMLNVGSAVDKDWVLYAAAADPSIMRNRLVFDTFRDMTGSWSVQSRYVELIVDGEYKGIYVFMDKITNNANRVNITDENGFILKFDKTDIVDRYEGSGDKKTFKSLYSGKDGSGTYDTQIDQRFEIEYPEMEDVEEEEAGKWATTVNNIKSMINNFETQLKAGNYAEVQKIIDYKSWADWFIITEYAKNMDAYRASCLFVYNGDKLEARPLWDQELSFKNYCATLCDDYSCDNAEGLLIRTSKIYEDTESCSAPFWFTGKYVQGRGTEAIGGSQQFVGYLLNDPCFVQTVKDRWNEHKNKALSAESLNAKLERYTNEMATALDREKSIWKSEGGKLSRETCQCSYNGTTGYSDIKISDSKGDITEWINARPSELEEALKDEIGTGLSISFSEENINTTPWEPVVLQVHNESGYHYTLTYTDNALDQQAGIIIEKNGDTYKYNIPRPANWGTGNEDTEGERADIVYGLKATLQMDSSNVVCGSQAEVPFDEATITLQDEPNEDCVQP